MGKTANAEPSVFQRTYEMRELARAMLPESEREAVFDRLHLSKRQREIALCFFEDLNEHAIRMRLGISAGTVKTFTQRLYGKLGVNSRIACLMTILQVRDYLRSTTPD